MYIDRIVKLHPDFTICSLNIHRQRVGGVSRFASGLADDVSCVAGSPMCSGLVQGVNQSRWTGGRVCTADGQVNRNTQTANHAHAHVAVADETGCVLVVQGRSNHR